MLYAQNPNEVYKAQNYNPENTTNSTQLKNPEQNLFDYANLLYFQKSYGLAITKYKSFLELYPNSENTLNAMYYLAESYYSTGQIEESNKIYEEIIKKFQSGKYYAFAAFRLASSYYQKKDYENSAKHYGIAAKHTDITKVKITALDRQSRILIHLDKNEQAIIALKKLINLKDDNPFREKAMVQISRLYLYMGKLNECINVSEELISITQNNEMKAEALTICGDALMVQGKESEALEKYQATMRLGKIPEKLRSKARFGIMIKSYEEKNWQSVVSIFRSGLSGLSQKQRSQMLLITANSYRHLGDCENALELYRIAKTYYGDTENGRDASFRSLQCYYNNNDPRLPSYVDAFVQNSKNLDKKNEYIDRALLLKGDYLFTIEKNYPKAVKAFRQVRINKIPEKLHEIYEFKYGWTLAYSDNYREAITVINDFIDKYKESDFYQESNALLAMCYMKIGEHKKALEKYATIIKEFPQSPVAEVAMLNTAIITGENLKQHDKMVELLKEFIKKYPDSENAELASYKIGQSYIEQKKFYEALPFLKKAKDTKSKNLGQKAGYLFIVALYYQREPIMLMNAVDDYLSKKYSQTIPPEVIAWLASELFNKDMNNRAEYYFELIIDKNFPTNIPPAYWHTYGKVKHNLDKYQEALEIFNLVIKEFPKSNITARSHLDKGKTYLAMKEYESAIKEANLANNMLEEQIINAECSILLGDIYFDQKNYKKALENYAVIALTWEDPSVTPTALYKMAQAQKKLQMEEEAKNTEKTLQEKYPNFIYSDDMLKKKKKQTTN